VALASQLGASWGQHYLDSLGSSIVASMLAHSACGSLRDSLDDLLDYNPASESDTWTRCGRHQLSQSIRTVQGIRNHTLRTRRMGPYCLVDATIVVDARISASAASMLAEAVHDRVIKDFAPFVTDVLVHVDPDGSPQSHHLQTHKEPGPMVDAINPEEVEAKVRASLKSLPVDHPELPAVLEITELQTYYYMDNFTNPADVADSPYVDVKLDFRLSTEEATLRGATALARVARKRIMAALPGVVRDVDIDLELDETVPEDVPSTVLTPSESPVTTATCESRMGGAGHHHGSWGMEPCMAPATKPAAPKRSLQQVTLVWERGAESREARVPSLRHEQSFTWTPVISS